MNLRRQAIHAIWPALVLTLGAWAHHSVAVNFDRSREITIQGVLTEMTWRNPHSHFRIDVTTDDGSQLEWLVEMGAINTMRRAGFEVGLFVPGETVSITGWPGWRDRTLYLNSAILQDGTELICAGASCNPER